MGYFSNGSEGRIYQNRWCGQCKNEDVENEVFCPIWTAHLLYNGDEALNELIPYKNGENGKCKMYRPVEKVEPLIKLSEHQQGERLIF